MRYEKINLTEKERMEKVFDIHKFVTFYSF